MGANNRDRTQCKEGYTKLDSWILIRVQVGVVNMAALCVPVVRWTVIQEQDLQWNCMLWTKQALSQNGIDSFINNFLFFVWGSEIPNWINLIEEKLQHAPSKCWGKKTKKLTFLLKFLASSWPFKRKALAACRTVGSPLQTSSKY